MTDNPQTIDAFNRLLREVRKALPYWKERKEDIDVYGLVYFLFHKDAEVRESMFLLIESIINEHES